MRRHALLSTILFGAAAVHPGVVLAAAKSATSVYRAYDGPARPAESVALLRAGSDTWIRAFDGRALADIRVGVFFELPAGRHVVRLQNEVAPSSSSSAELILMKSLELEFEGGRAYRVRWEKLVPVIEPHPEPLPALAKEDDEPCWYDEIRGQLESFVWGKTFRERLKNPAQLTLRVDGSDEPRTWEFPSVGVLAQPAGMMQKLASNWSVDGTFHGYLIGTKPLVPGRRVRALVSTCQPDEIREVILE